MILSPRGIRRLSAEEWSGKNGLHADGRFYVYPDYKGLPTIGIGHLVRAGEDWSRGLSLDDVIALFHHDLGTVYEAIRKGVSYGYNQAEWDSMVVTGHNCGPGFFHPPSCTAVRCLNAHDVDGYCRHLLDWNKSGHPPVFDPNLYARRQREAQWFREAPPPPEPDFELKAWLEKALAQQFDLRDQVDWMGRQPSQDPLEEIQSRETLPAPPDDPTPIADRVTKPDIA